MSVAWQANFDKHARKIGDLQLFLDDLKNEMENTVLPEAKAALDKFVAQYESRMNICKGVINDARFHLEQMTAQLDYIEDDELLFGFGAKLQISLEELENAQTMWNDARTKGETDLAKIVDDIMDELWWDDEI